MFWIGIILGLLVGALVPSGLAKLRALIGKA